MVTEEDVRKAQERLLGDGFVMTPFIGPKDYDEFEFGGCGCFLDSDEVMA